MLDLVVSFEGKAWHNVHGEQLLEKQFTGVRHLQRGHVLRRLAVLAPGNTQHIYTTLYTTKYYEVQGVAQWRKISKSNMG